MPSVQVSTATPADYPTACRALFADRPTAEQERLTIRLLGRIASGDVDPSGFLVARHGLSVIGAALCQLHPGHAAVVWLPPGASEVARRALAEEMVRWLQGHGVKVAQTHCHPHNAAEVGPLLAVGFRHVCRIELLCRPVDADRDKTLLSSIPSPLTLARTDATDAGFGELILATYEGSRDCPELNGSRTAAEVLAGYASLPQPRWWRVTRHGEPVGVLLLNSDTPGVVDLSYVGLVPSARGRGWGAALVRQALAEAAGWPAEWVQLSVDTRNDPALRVYQSLAFRRQDSQDVYLWQAP